MGVTIGIMVSSKLTLLFAIVLWASVEGTPLEEESRELEMRAKFEERAMMMETANRDMHNWWAEYDILMANYRAMFADNVCHNPDMLNASLLIIEAKIEKVRWGWTLKGEQLDLIRDILHHEDYKNITGLARVLNQFLEEQMTKWTWRANTLTKKSLRWQQPRLPSTPTPAHVSGRNGATGDCAVPPVEEEFPPGTGESRRKLSMVVNSAREAPMMRRLATKNPAPSTANGASGLPGVSATKSMGMDKSIARGCTWSLPCLEARNAKVTTLRPWPATTFWSAGRKSSKMPRRSKGWKTSWKTESNS